MLELTDVRSGYGSTPVLHGVCLELHAGERAAVLGRNGAGKTTLMRTIAGSIACTSGGIRFNGIELRSLKPHRRARLGIAHVPQGRHIFAKLSVLENLKVGAAAASDRGAARLGEVFDELPLLAQKRRAPGGSLSGGQQQILALGRALMTDPKLLLLDEPSEGIQPSILDEIVEVVDRINVERRITLLIVEQNLTFASRLAARGLIMDKGELITEVETGKLLADKELHRKYMAL